MVKRVPLVIKLRDLAEELDEGELSDEEVRRQVIETVKSYRKNPVVAGVISGNPDYPQEFISQLDKKWGSEIVDTLTNFGKFFPPFFPRRKDKKYNAQVAITEEIFPYASSFRTNGILSFDNPIGGATAGSLLLVVPAIVRYAISPLVQSVSGLSDQEIQQFYDNVRIFSEVYGSALGFIVGGIYSTVRFFRRAYTRRGAKDLSGIFSDLFKNTQ